MKVTCPNCGHEFEPKKLKCLRCDHEWQQRGDKPPKVCPNPKCKSPYWDRERTRKLKKKNKNR